MNSQSEYERCDNHFVTHPTARHEALLELPWIDLAALAQLTPGSEANGENVLLGARTLLGAPGMATRSKDATRGSWPYY